MKIESPDMTVANLANSAKTQGGKQDEFCSLAMANLANLANFNPDEPSFSRFSQKSHSQPAKVIFPEGEQGDGFSQISRFSHSQPPEFDFSARHRRLSDSDLASLITLTAIANGLDPLDLWRWVDLDSIEALRSGDPAEIRAFQAMIALPGWDSTPPATPHGLPFPGVESVKMV